MFNQTKNSIVLLIVGLVCCAVFIVRESAADNHTGLLSSFVCLFDVKPHLNDLQATIEKQNDDLKSLQESLKELRNQMTALNTRLANAPLGSCKGSSTASSSTGNCNDLNDLDSSWIMIQRRQDGSVDFYRDWNAYKSGFGDLSGEFWMGLERIHVLTSERPHELLIRLQDFNGKCFMAKYDHFIVGSEAEGYPLTKLGKYEGDDSDSMSQHLSLQFSTKDRDHDTYSGNCAQEYKGGWWYKSCYHSNLNGLYLTNPIPDDKNGQGITWVNYKKNHSLKYVAMLIRPKSNKNF